MPADHDEIGTPAWEAAVLRRQAELDPGAAESLRRRADQLDPPVTDDVNIGDTVEVTTATGTGFTTWRAELLDIVGGEASAWVQCVTPGAGLRPGERTTVPHKALRRVGDPDGMRESDKCDDVDVTGRVRPYHRHAVTGKAHAHVGGQLAHTHQAVTSRRQAVSNGTVATTASVLGTLRNLADTEPVLAVGVGINMCGLCEVAHEGPAPFPHADTCPWVAARQIVRAPVESGIEPTVCRCGHPESAHERRGWRACSLRDGCGCQLFSDRTRDLFGQAGAPDGG